MNADTEPKAGNPGKHGNLGNAGNPGNPGEKKCRAKVIAEGEVERYLEAGWEIAAPLGNGEDNESYAFMRQTATAAAVGSLNLVSHVGRLPLAVASALLLVSIIPACASASTVGVRLGDWWEYGIIGPKWESTDPEATVPPETTEMMETCPAWYRFAVLSVSGTTVVLEMTVGFRNGTQVKGQAAGDLATGTGNLTDFLFPAGLSKGDWPWGTMGPQDSILGAPPIPPTHINDTVSRTYAGATREVNVMSGTQASGVTEMTMIIIFDKMTGIACEIFFGVSSTQGDWVTTMSNTMELTATNAWRGTEIPEIGGISGAMGLLSVIVLGQPFAKKRREGPTRSGGQDTS